MLIFQKKLLLEQIVQVQEVPHLERELHQLENPFVCFLVVWFLDFVDFDYDFDGFFDWVGGVETFLYEKKVPDWFPDPFPERIE